MWAYVTDNTIQEIIRFPKSMVIDNVRHPRAIFTAWSWTELNNIGIYTVEPGTQGDDRFEITSQPTYAFDSSNKKVTTTYTKTDKALADSNAVDGSGNPILDDHDNQVVILGLKSVAKNKCKKQANELIKRFNWLVERYTYDNSKTIPSAVSTYVTNVRNSCTTICMPLTIVLIWLLSRHYITIHMTVTGILQQLLRLGTGLMTMMYKLMKGK